MIKKCVQNVSDDSLKGWNIKIWTGLDVSMKSVESGSMGFVLEWILRQLTRWKQKVNFTFAHHNAKRNTKNY